jgi:hypothetical protein
MSDLIRSLRDAGAQHKGTELGGLLQWAALHIAEQSDAIAELREELADEERARLHLEQSAHEAKAAIEAALAAIKQPLCPPVEFARDLVGHINIMAGHGDPDYLNRSGNSIRHVDCRSAKGKK